MSTAVTVIAVGDGASSVLTAASPWGVAELAVIDCGVRHGSPIAAGTLLADQVAPHARRLNEVVVSHFDVDHWWGLRHFATDPRIQGQVPGLDLFYPAMPTAVPAALFSFLSASPHGVAPIDLRERLQPALAAGGRIHTRALSRGDQVTLAGERFDVLWPPAALNLDENPQLGKVVNEVRDLARDLAQAGHPEMQENLDAGMEALDAEGFIDALTGGGETPDRFADDAPLAVVTPESWLPADDAELDDLQDLDDPDDAEDKPGLVTIPPEYRARFKRTYRRIRAANNALSLILAARSGLIVCYGDATVVGQSQAAADLQGRDFAISLAPHHGTWTMPDGTAHSSVCVSQAGKGHAKNWHRHQASAPHALECLNTNDTGTMTMSAWPPPWFSRLHPEFLVRRHT